MFRGRGCEEDGEANLPVGPSGLLGWWTWVAAVCDLMQHGNSARLTVHALGAGTSITKPSQFHAKHTREQIRARHGEGNLQYST